MKLNNTQVLSLEDVSDRGDLCEFIYHKSLNSQILRSQFYGTNEELLREIYNNFDLLITQLITDNEVIIDLIVLNIFYVQGFLQDASIKNFIFSSNLKAKDLISVLKYEFKTGEING